MSAGPSKTLRGEREAPVIPTWRCVGTAKSLLFCGFFGGGPTLAGRRSGQQRATKDARMRAELGDDRVVQGYADIVDAGSWGTDNLGRGRNQTIAELGRL